VEILVFVIVIAFLIMLARIEVNTKKKLENDERIIERLDLLINDLRKRNNGDEIV
jgi:uncharacterized membrane protein